MKDTGKNSSGERGGRAPGEDRRQTKDAPLDGSTSGTIGGGGPDTGGPTHHATQPDNSTPNPDDAASGRMAPDPLAAANPPDPTKTSRTDTSNAAARDSDEDTDRAARARD